MTWLTQGSGNRVVFTPVPPSSSSQTSPTASASEGFEANITIVKTTKPTHAQATSNALGIKHGPRDQIAERAQAAFALLTPNLNSTSTGALPPFPLFCACLCPVQTLPNPPKPRSLNWTSARVRSVLDALEEEHHREDVSLVNVFPIFVLDHLFKEFGLASLVDATAWDLVLSVHVHRTERRDVDAFARFFEQAHDADDLAFYLHARKTARRRQKKGSFASRAQVATFVGDAYAENAALGHSFLEVLDADVSPHSFPVLTDDVLWLAVNHYHEQRNRLAANVSLDYALQQKRRSES